MPIWCGFQLIDLPGRLCKHTSMNPGLAEVLFREGATLFVLDLPEGSEFGIDFNSWNVGPNFCGMKMIPPGVHFVYYRYGWHKDFVHCLFC